MSDLVGNHIVGFLTRRLICFPGFRRSIAQRSAILIDKLQRADIGSRPIIWVGHSMGGKSVITFIP